MDKKIVKLRHDCRIEDVKMIVAKAALKTDLEDTTKGTDEQMQDIN